MTSTTTPIAHVASPRQLRIAHPLMWFGALREASAQRRLAEARRRHEARDRTDAYLDEWPELPGRTCRTILTHAQYR